MSPYKHLFFDLDRTLWDFDLNNRETFLEMCEFFKLEEKGIKDSELFYNLYQKINLALWDAYKTGAITKERLNFSRFFHSLNLYNIADNELATQMGAWYIRESPLKTHLYPGTLETLEKLFPKYQMHIVTNGFEEVQFTKIENSGLNKYFQSIITSEMAGYKKPDKRFFEYAFRETGAKPEDSIIIGDDPEADILGAHQIGMDQIWVKHKPLKPETTKPTFAVNTLHEILEIL
ncbi:MAG: YjjG family noncanonical pyrimidine nucleotidase [Bacteroidales bacterium]|nr:YjjG family noncanonical pyrimidine nucleotidase [Bacteroidales bacterium]